VVFSSELKFSFSLPSTLLPEELFLYHPRQFADANYLLVIEVRKHHFDVTIIAGNWLKEPCGIEMPTYGL